MQPSEDRNPAVSFSTVSRWISRSESDSDIVRFLEAEPSLVGSCAAQVGSNTDDGENCTMEPNKVRNMTLWALGV